jgi:ribose-phosphate pyrophosphokinase
MLWIRTPSDSVKYQRFTFPDGQPHFTIEPFEGFEATIEASICNPTELFDVLLVHEVLSRQGVTDIDLDIRYLMGARMDRPIDEKQPFTLYVVASVLRALRFRCVRVLDPHSYLSIVALRGSAVYPTKAVRIVLSQHDPKWTTVVVPDKGAETRVRHLMKPYPDIKIVQALKERDPQTGKLSGFTVLDPDAVRGHDCLILDDICDGGGTFSGLGEQLIKLGALQVDLFVTHGIFSKGLPIPFIHDVWTTDSYQPAKIPGVTVIPVQMGQADQVG